MEIDSLHDIILPQGDTLYYCRRGAEKSSAIHGKIYDVQFDPETLHTMTGDGSENRYHLHRLSLILEMEDKTHHSGYKQMYFARLSLEDFKGDTKCFWYPEDWAKSCGTEIKLLTDMSKGIIGGPKILKKFTAIKGMKSVEIKQGWGSAGKRGLLLGSNVECEGMEWTPVLWEDEEDPDWFKTQGLIIE